MTRVLVTGASGQLGSYVIPRFAEAGHEVTGFDQVRGDRLDPSVPFVLGDLVDLGDCMRALAYSRPEVIIHLGAIPWATEIVGRTGFRSQQSGPEDRTMRINTMGTYSLLEAARRIGGVRQVVFASTYYVLGLGFRISDSPFQVDYLPIDEEHPLRPEDSYSLSKLFGEQLLESYARAYGIRGVAFRLMGVDYPHRPDHQYGNPAPASSPKHVGGPIMTTYQYVDARDVANACLLAMDAEGLDDFEAFYLTTDTVYEENTKDLVQRVWPDLAESAQGIQGTEGVISDAKVRRKLGYEPQYSWRNGSQ